MIKPEVKMIIDFAYIFSDLDILSNDREITLYVLLRSYWGV